MSDTDTAETKGPREVSKIQFPYLALDDAMGMARRLLDAGGVPMDRDQLAAALGTAPSGGNFAIKLSALRMFGLLETDSQGRYALTPLGFEILDPARERAAKVEAFLSVELFRSVYETFKGKQLPPRPIGLEQALVSLGVTPKQKDRARTTLDRSARLAGFFPTNSEDRLVRPLSAPVRDSQVVPTELTEDYPPERPPALAPTSVPAQVPVDQGLDSVITALISKLPKSGGKFSEKEREKWLQMMGMAFEMAYGTDQNASEQ